MWSRFLLYSQRSHVEQSVLYTLFQDLSRPIPQERVITANRFCFRTDQTLKRIVSVQNELRYQEQRGTHSIKALWPNHSLPRISSPFFPNVQSSISAPSTSHPSPKIRCKACQNRCSLQTMTHHRGWIWIEGRTRERDMSPNEKILVEKGSGSRPEGTEMAR
jgi:hypothetical protein